MRYVLYDVFGRRGWFDFHGQSVSPEALGDCCGPSSCNTGLSFWLGAEALNEEDY